MLPSGEPPAAPLQVIANACAAGSCPTVYTTDSGTVLVQGYAVPPSRHAGIDVPAGELLVEVPAHLLAEAVRNLPALER